ncbi:phosphomethylpyrimidine kinase [Malaciobacter mytili LMG 24559]|uniref:Phosphomethylpyrimidine kinase n=1 Tax=Malaciobacter mytili LMG 24559 TaxID=1032238 RepID=A0AAX2ADX3_9BACT|nr:DUF2779 domain-containing protein [Malaciobacter mytili]AXH15179.1 DUF2779 domain-containing protein [Malaciobacter mytili LMG 24559]RXK14785.1 phosphomethylpyrimidine kinase [Malaciobacter mytili LMG 24559]
MNLSKSLYTKGIQCPKALWLKKYKPSVLTPPDEQAQAIFETGNIVGDLACQLFSDGKEVPYTTNYDEMISTTKEWMEEGISNIYEATFTYEGILIMVDILKVKDDGVSIYEVKSSTEVKDIYLYDVSIQYYILQNLGFSIKSASVVHINNEYVRGESLELDKLFKIVDVTSEVQKLQSNIPSILKEFETYLEDKENEPDIDIGSHCNKPYECDAKNYCWKVQRDIPEYSIFNIFNLGSKKQIELYNRGIINIDDVPHDFDMTSIQSQAVENYKSKITYIDIENIKSFLQSLTYPIYHLDFETYQQAIPQYKGLKPFEQIPFQYSLHIEYEDGQKNKLLEHKEYLSEDSVDSRYELALRLCEDIPSNVTVLAYNMSFEKGVIKRLANLFPDLSTHLLAINENIQDLMIPFQKKWYVTPSMQGSYSIKYVLPALVPEFKKAYKELDGVQNGSQAMNAFENLSKLDDEEKQKIRTSLLEYCKLDTLAMVKVLEKLRNIVI